MIKHRKLRFKEIFSTDSEEWLLTSLRRLSLSKPGNLIAVSNNEIEYLPEEMGNMGLSELNLVGNPIKEVPRSFKNLSRSCTFVVSKKMPEETLRQFKQICGTDRLRYKESISIRRGR